MKRRNGSGRFPIEHIGRVVMNSRMMKALVGKVKGHLAGVSARRMRTICIIVLAGMFIGDILLAYRAAYSPRAAPPVSCIRITNAAGVERRQERVKAFGHVWDSLMLDPAMKKSWEELVKIRPGLADTLRQLQRMDSAAAGK